MRFGLYGIYGTYNFGCEAIVRGTYAYLKGKYPGCEVLYFSYAYEYDCRTLRDLDLTIIEIKYTRNIFKKIANRIFSLFNSNIHLLMIDYKKLLKNIDVVVSIGGDIYTIPEHFRKQKKYPYYNSLIHFCDKALRMKKEVMVYGASVGPWGEYSKAVNYYKKAMIKYGAIICREMKSINYLKKLGFNNYSFAPDPAFMVKALEAIPKKKRYLGINLSPLSFHEVNGSYDSNTIVALAKLLDSLYEKYNIEIMLVPHVLSKSINDNDFAFMQKIREKMKHSDGTVIADCSKGFLGIKNQIRECCVVVSARMHCAINAIVEGIPTIFLAYSQKSIGMCEFVYGNTDFVINIKDLSKMLVERLDYMLNNMSLIEYQINKRLQEITEMNSTF